MAFQNFEFLLKSFRVRVRYYVILIQTNISNEEYVRMLRVYEESVVQTEVLSSLQKAMETEEHLTIQKQLPRKSQLKPTGNSTYLFGKNFTNWRDSPSQVQ